MWPKTPEHCDASGLGERETFHSDTDMGIREYNANLYAFFFVFFFFFEQLPVVLFVCLIDFLLNFINI